MSPTFSRAPLPAVLAALRSTASPEAVPPPWLWAEQVCPWRRSVAAVRQFGGVLLNLPVGSGKTYVALATATAVAPGEPVQVIVPAVLIPQWRDVAARLGLSIAPLSHEMVSRGAAPGGDGPVLIDESHRFREPGSRRYQTLAPALVGRPVILATATPVVNRRTDLVAQLLLAVPDDALRHYGLATLRDLRDASAPPAALDYIVIRSTRPSAGLPARSARRVPFNAEPALLGAVTAIERLGCARDPTIGGLIRGTLWRALSSSPAALLAALGRYDRLLGHARAAATSGRRLSRRALIDTIGSAPDQLLLWDLLPAAAEPTDLCLEDHGRVARLRRRLATWCQAGDEKLRQLRVLLADRQPTLVFAAAVETVQYLRTRLALPGTAWVTGAGAGTSGCRASRHAVLSAFGASQDRSVPRPWLLLCSDVAAEGLNLQGASRIVHYDLPWTAVRLAQRDGRAIRLGSNHATVEVVELGLPPEIEARLGIGRAIARKAALPNEVGLESPWISQDATPGVGWAVARSDASGALAALGWQSAPPLLLGRCGDGGWSADRRTVDRLLLQAAAAKEAEPLEDLDPVLQPLSLGVEQWIAATLLPKRRSGSATLRALRTRAAAMRRSRKADALAEVSAAHRFAARGHTAGEAAFIKGLRTGDSLALGRARVGGSGPATATADRPRLQALIVFDGKGG